MEEACMIAKDIHYIGVNDHRIDLFESQYTVPNAIIPMLSQTKRLP